MLRRPRFTALVDALHFSNRNGLLAEIREHREPIYGIISVSWRSDRISPGYEAVLLNEIIQPGHKHSWMTGGQAVAAGIALVVLGSLQIAAFIISRAKRGIKQRPVGRST